MASTKFDKLKMPVILEGYKNYPNLTVILGLGSVYLAYYLLKVVKKPELACNKKFGAFLKAHCPAICQKYWPTWWCFEGKAQTIMRSLMKSYPKLSYQKEFLYLSDGGHVALDWLHNENNSKYPKATRPTVVILPGLTGSSDESYVRHLAKQTLTLGYRCVVFNYRGFGGAELKTARTYCAANTEDLFEVIQSIKKQIPDAPLLAVGISLGGLILTNYLAKHQGNERLVAAMTVSAPWNVFESSKTLEETVNSLVFNRHLTENLKNTVRRYEHMFKDSNKFDLNKVYESKTIRQFDDRFTSLQFGYHGYKDYYDDACIHNKIQHINIPLLCLNAADDPFSPEHAIPLDEARQSECVAIAQTSHGGHIGFLEGFFPRHRSFMDRVFAEYVFAVFENLNALKEIFNH